MKNILLTALLIAGLSSARAEAGSAQRFHVDLKTNSWSKVVPPILKSQTPPEPNEPPQPTPATPIRQANIKVTFNKTVVRAIPGGSFEFKQQDICTRTATVDVFDLRSAKDSSILLNASVSCSTDYKGTPSEIWAAGFIAFENGSVHPNEAPADLKKFFTFGSIVLQSNPSALDSSIIPSVLAISRDLNLASAIAVSSQPIHIECDETTCSGAKDGDEFLGFTFEFMDPTP